MSVPVSKTVMKGGFNEVPKSSSDSSRWRPRELRVRL